MVKLPFAFNARGYEFQSALDVLRKSAQIGSTALSSEIKELEQQLEGYRQSGDFKGERDKEGYVIWEQDQILEYEIASANDALMELRKAFAIVAYHHWERSVQQWIADGSGTTARAKDFKELLNAARGLGYPADPALENIMNLANTLKHINEKHGIPLLKIWPDIFPLQFTGPSRLSDWAEAIQLTDRHLTKIFDIILKSGPTTSLAA